MSEKGQKARKIIRTAKIGQEGVKRHNFYIILHNLLSLPGPGTDTPHPFHKEFTESPCHLIPPSPQKSSPYTPYYDCTPNTCADRISHTLNKSGRVAKDRQTVVLHALRPLKVQSL
jgi:hypothetical protein